MRTRWVSWPAAARRSRAQFELPCKCAGSGVLVARQKLTQLGWTRDSCGAVRCSAVRYLTGWEHVVVTWCLFGTDPSRSRDGEADLSLTVLQLLEGTPFGPNGDLMRLAMAVASSWVRRRRYLIAPQHCRLPCLTLPYLTLPA